MGSCRAGEVWMSTVDCAKGGVSGSEIDIVESE